MNITLMCGKQAGLIGLLTILTEHNIIAAVSYSDETTEALEYHQVPLFSSIKDKGFISYLKDVDALVSVHGKEIVPKKLLKLVPLALNVHPYLYKYKGADPVGRALKDKCCRASVGVHFMRSKVDEGEVIEEEFKTINIGTRAEIYNQLYPLYSVIILKVLRLLDEDKKNEPALRATLIKHFGSYYKANKKWCLGYKCFNKPMFEIQTLLRGGWDEKNVEFYKGVLACQERLREKPAKITYPGGIR